MSVVMHGPVKSSKQWSPPRAIAGQRLSLREHRENLVRRQPGNAIAREVVVAGRGVVLDAKIVGESLLMSTAAVQEDHGDLCIARRVIVDLMRKAVDRLRRLHCSRDSL